MKPAVFMTRALPGDAMGILAERCALDVNRRDRPVTKKELITGVREADALVSMLSDPIDRRVIEAGPRLKIIANYAVGYNNIDLSAATERGIVVTNTPGVLTETTADLTWALILSIARRIIEADRYTRKGRWTGWAPTLFLGRDVCGKTLGILGMGRIGQAVARRARGFSMKVIYHSRRRVPKDTEDMVNARFVSLAELLALSDFLTLHVPLTPSTHHLIGKKELMTMKRPSYVINTSRGPVVDEKALAWALRTGVLAGAALDVFEKEPRIAPSLLSLENVVLLPHVGSATHETRLRMAMMVAEDVLAVLEGRQASRQVNSRQRPC